MKSYKLILPASMASHITYSRENCELSLILSKYFNAKWGKNTLVYSPKATIKAVCLSLPEGTVTASFELTNQP